MCTTCIMRRQQKSDGGSAHERTNRHAGPRRDVVGRAGRRRRADLSEPDHQVRRPVRGRERDRYAGAAGWPARLSLARPKRGCGEYRRRQRRHRCAECGALDAGRLHGLHHVEHHACVQPEPVEESALRRGHRFRAGHQARHHHAGAGCASERACQRRQGIDRLCQGQSRKTDLRQRLDVVAGRRRIAQDRSPASTSCIFPTRAIRRW